MKTAIAMRTAMAGLLFITLAGCASVGPGSVHRDREDYIQAISESWKRQMLLNLVKTRYGDAPVYLDVVSVINQYELAVTARGVAGWGHNPFSSSQTLEGAGGYRERPTITYSPLSGERFARSFMRPIPPLAVLQVLHSGYRADTICRLLVQSMNGISNRYGGSLRTLKSDPEFFELIAKLQMIQDSGALAVRIKEEDGKSGALMVFDPKRDEAVTAQLASVRELLGLSPEATELSVVFGSTAANDREIAMLTRSMLQITVDIASQIEVPEKDVAEKRVSPTFQESGAPADLAEPLIRVQCSPRHPKNAFVAVPYRDHWFWIDDRDYYSKNMFSFLMFLFSLTETGDKEDAPIVTITAN